MRKLAVFLLVAFFCFLFAAVWSEPLTAAEFWDSMAWSRIKIPLIVFVIVTALAAILLLQRRADRRHDQAVETHAQKRGWSCSRADDQNVAALLEAILPGRRFFVLNVRVVKPAHPRIILFDCTHRIPEKERNHSISTGCLVMREQHMGPASCVEIFPAMALDGLLLPNLVETGDEAFGREFLVQGTNADEARRIVTTGLRLLLLEEQKRHPAQSIRVAAGTGGVFFLSGTTAWLDDETQLDALVELAATAASAIESR